MEIYQQYKHEIYRHALFVTGNPHDAEDVGSEVFAKICAKHGQYRGEGLRTWVWSISRNCLTDLLRKRKRKSAPLTDEMIASLPDNDVRGTLLEWKELFSTLTTDQRSVIYWRILQGYSVQETRDRWMLRHKSTRSHASRLSSPEEAVAIGHSFEWEGDFVKDDNELLRQRLAYFSSTWKSIDLPKTVDDKISRFIQTYNSSPSRIQRKKRVAFTSTVVGLSGVAILLLLWTQLIRPNSFTITSKDPTNASITATIQLRAVKAQSNGSLSNTSVAGVRFVIVDASGKVIGTHQGPGKISVTVPTDGFWNSANKAALLGKIGTVEILAYAPHMIDTIMVDVPVSSAPIADTPLIPMIPMVNPQGQNTPNEPYIVLGTNEIQHLVTDAVSQYYSKYAHITSSFLRKNP